MFKEQVEQLIKNEEFYLKKEGELHKNYISFLNTKFDIEGLLKTIYNNYNFVIVVDRPIVSLDICDLKDYTVKMECIPIKNIYNSKGDIFILYIPYVCDKTGEFNFLYGKSLEIPND